MRNGTVREDEQTDDCLKRAVNNFLCLGAWCIRVSSPELSYIDAYDGRRQDGR